MAGWGRRAAGKIDRTQYGQDELLLTLGGQFNVNFSDYEKWKRTSKPTTKTTESSKHKGSGVKAQHVVGPGHRMTRICSTRGHAHKHGDTDNSLSPQSVEKLKILELRLHTRRKTLAQYVRRRRTLLVDNMALRETIEEYERLANGHVKSLLRKYEGLRNGISNLTTLAGKEIAAAEMELLTTRNRLEAVLSGLETELNIIDSELQEKLKELQILQSYKDKEYPVKAIEITDLGKELEEVKILNGEEQEELEYIIKTEIEKYTKKQDRTIQDITEQVTEVAISTMHPSLQKMAIQNKIMAKEVEFHRREQEELEESVASLRSEVNKLLSDPKSDTRKQMFPEFFPKFQKCTPDMDVVLDIPVHQWLPI